MDDDSTLSSRVFVLLYCGLSEIFPGKVDCEVLLKIYSSLDTVLSIGGNKGFKEIKEWESMVLSIILEYHDPLSCARKYSDWFKS